MLTDYSVNLHTILNNCKPNNNKKTVMKRTIKVSMMALVAMFAFSTVANAQFGGLLKGASKAVGSGLIKGKKKTKSENVEVMNWKAGQMVTVENPFNAEAKPWKSEWIYDKEKNFQDKEMKKKLVELYLDDEKFNNRKRAADDITKDRKIVEILFVDDSWKFNRDNLGDILSRYLNFLVVSELTNGFTIVDECYVVNKYTGGGNYDTNFKFSLDVMAYTNFGTYIKYDKRYLVTDWQHKDDADPMAQYK